MFHIPQKFFDCLQQRMSVGISGRKKRLPNTSASFVRRDSVPLGNFVKYTWRLTNVLHIKQIFDTPQVWPDNELCLYFTTVYLLRQKAARITIKTCHYENQWLPLHLHVEAGCFYTVSQKKGPLYFCPQLWQMLTDFRNFYIVEFIKKFATN